MRCYINSYFSLEKELEELEVKLKIMQRWKRDDPQFCAAQRAAEERKKLELIQKMRKLSVDWAYLKDARKKYSGDDNYVPYTQ